MPGSWRSAGSHGRIGYDADVLLRVMPENALRKTRRVSMVPREDAAGYRRAIRKSY